MTFGRSDFWDHLGGQTLVMTGRSMVFKETINQS